MEGINLIPTELRPYPRHFKEPLIRSFWIAIVAAIFIGAFSVSVIFFSAVSRGAYKKARNSVPISEVKKIWIKKSLTRCAEEWDIKNITPQEYLNSLGIEVFNKIIIRDPSFSENTSCQACSCISGDLLHLYVPVTALEDLTGFHETPPPE